jgi:hypothetical protein
VNSIIGAGVNSIDIGAGVNIVGDGAALVGFAVSDIEDTFVSAYRIL